VRRCPDEHLSTWLFGQNPGARDGAMRALLSAPWSFLHHPAGTVEDHLTALEERLRVLEARLVGDLETAVDGGRRGRRDRRGRGASARGRY